MQIYGFLRKTTPKETMKLKTILIFLVLIIFYPAHSRPARIGITPLMQPDGTIFEARITGDEFCKITTTADGCAIIQNEEGWWCYAEFDENGNRASTGWAVGGEAPYAVISASRRIPYASLSASAVMKRSVLPREEMRFIERLGPATRNGDAAIKHGIVILAQYSDVKFTYSREDFVDLLTLKGYSRNGASGSAKEYFDEQFVGKVDFRFDVSEIVTIPGKRADYGGNRSNGDDKDPASMIIEACRAADATTDFSLYDDDGDGEIDNVFVFFAGGDEAEGAGEDCIWSHAWYIYNGAGQTVMLDGKMLNRYACTSELTRRYYNSKEFDDILTGIGTFCHEYSHTFGLPDLYDTDYEGSGGNAAGLWLWTALMDGGNQNNGGNTPPYFNALEREILGLSEPSVIEANGSYRLEPINAKGQSYRINTDDENEYYLIECRSGEGWDKYIGGSGLLIYHIDKSARGTGTSDLYGTDLTAEQRWSANEVNARPDHQCADLIEADSRQDSFTSIEDATFRSLLTETRGIFFPYQGTDAIASERLVKWSGQPSTISIRSISKERNGISFTVTGLDGTIAPPEVGTIQTETFPDAAIIQFESSYPFEGEAVVEWGRTGLETESVRVMPYEPGRYALVLQGLEPGNKTYTARIAFEADGASGEPSSVSFMTKRKPAVTWPYIYIASSSRNENGTFPQDAQLPLMLCNIGDAAEVNWSYDGESISRQGNGYYTAAKSGTLMAEIIWKDGKVEKIVKEITISTDKND